MFWTVPLSIIRSFSHTAMVYAIYVCWQLASRTRTELQFRPDPARCLYSEKLLMIDRGIVRNM